MNSTTKTHKTWRKLFFRCDYLEDEICKSSFCSKDITGTEMKCCVFCEERLRCPQRCKHLPFKKYIKREEGQVDG